MNKKLSTLAIAGLTLPFAWACASDGEQGPNSSTSSSTSTQSSSAPASTGTSGTGASGTSTGGSTSTTPTTSPGTTTTSGAQPGQTVTSRPTTPGEIPALVSVNLQNVLNDLSVRLQIDRANVPVNIQLPIELAANVCGVSVNVLALSAGGQGKCTATSAPQELAQVVQQQMAAGGSVGGGAQGGSTASTGGTPTSGTASGGATGTGATSSGTTETTTRR